MQSERRLGMLEYGKLLVTLAALVGFLLFTGAPRVRADESECQHRTERADHRLHEAIEHHGWDSSPKLNMRATNCTKRGNIVGITVTDGGTSKPTDGARTTTGTTTTGIHDKEASERLAGHG